MHRSTRPVTLAFLAMAAVIVPLSSAAQSSTFIQYFLNAGVPSTRVENFNGLFSTSGPSSDYYNPALTGLVSVSGASTYGTARATATGSGDGYVGGMFTGWTDTISIKTSSALLGTHVLWTVDLNANWTFQTAAAGSGNEYSQNFAYVDINLYQVNASGAKIGKLQYGAAGEENNSYCYMGACNSTVSAYGNTAPFASPAHYASGVGTITFDLISGASYFFEPGINAEVYGNGALSFVDASQPLSWGGSSLTDLDGHPLDYSVNSFSGFDYGQSSVAPIPEPSTYAMLMVGLLAIGFVGRRRRLGTLTTTAVCL